MSQGGRFVPVRMQASTGGAAGGGGRGYSNMGQFSGRAQGAQMLSQYLNKMVSVLQECVVSKNNNSVLCVWCLVFVSYFNRQ